MFCSPFCRENEIEVIFYWIASGMDIEYFRCQQVTDLLARIRSAACDAKNAN